MGSGAASTDRSTGARVFRQAGASTTSPQTRPRGDYADGCESAPNWTSADCSLKHLGSLGECRSGWAHDRAPIGSPPALVQLSSPTAILQQQNRAIFACYRLAQFACLTMSSALQK